MFKRISKLLLATTTLLALGVASPAHAYYWGYPYGYGPLSSVLWPVRAALYPLRGFGSGYYGPVSYGLGSLGYNASCLTNSLLGSPYYRPFYYPYPRPYMDMYSYQDEEPLNSPRRRVRGKRPELDTTDQIAQAQWTHPQGNQLAPAVAAPPGYVPPPGSPASIPPATGAAPPGVAAPAPPFAAPPAIAIGGNSPLAQGFVDLVNSKFDGDISRALFDPEARSWARSIGLVDNDQVFNADLSDERIGLIERVLRDRTLTAPTKIHSVKLLLHN